jgi:hypothetical protein
MIKIKKSKKALSIRFGKAFLIIDNQLTIGA